jgi:hypothetical protein
MFAEVRYIGYWSLVETLHEDGTVYDLSILLGSGPLHPLGPDDVLVAGHDEHQRPLLHGMTVQEACLEMRGLSVPVKGKVLAIDGDKGRAPADNLTKFESTLNEDFFGLPENSTATYHDCPGGEPDQTAAIAHLAGRSHTVTVDCLGTPEFEAIRDQFSHLGVFQD